MFIMSLPPKDLLKYLQAQISTFFPDGLGNNDELSKNWDLILERTEFCFSKNRARYFSDERGTLFNHLNGDHYSMFLYFASNTLYRNKCDLNLCDKLFQLNRCLHGIDVYYMVELPDIFLFSHPLGTVLGRAGYSNYLYVLQNCNVGGSVDADNQLKTPVLGEYVTLQGGARILGSCNVGNNCMIGANSLLLNRDLPDDSLYVGNPRDYLIKTRNFRDYNWDPQ